MIINLEDQFIRIEKMKKSQAVEVQHAIPLTESIVLLKLKNEKFVAYGHGSHRLTGGTYQFSFNDLNLTQSLQKALVRMGALTQKSVDAYNLHEKMKSLRHKRISAQRQLNKIAEKYGLEPETLNPTPEETELQAKYDSLVKEKQGEAV